MSTLHTYIYVRLRITDAVMGLCMTGITKAFIQIQYWPTLDQFGHIESLIYTRLVDWRHKRMHMSNIQLTCWACLNLEQARTSRIYHSTYWQLAWYMYREKLFEIVNDTMVTFCYWHEQSVHYICTLLYVNVLMLFLQPKVSKWPTA